VRFFYIAQEKVLKTPLNFLERNTCQNLFAKELRKTNFFLCLFFSPARRGALLPAQLQPTTTPDVATKNISMDMLFMSTKPAAQKKLWPNPAD
jgi:hypothetical protein